MKRGLTHRVLMIRPAKFALNQQTIATNGFQPAVAEESVGEIHRNALAEFDAFVLTLRKHAVEVVVFEDSPQPETPDAIFPNNWFSTAANSQLFTYPMASLNRRTERRKDLVDELCDTFGYQLNEQLLAYEQQGFFLEGTGSLVHDPTNNRAYAALSSRTNLEVIKAYETLSGNQVITFEAFGPKGEAIYHTNVILCIGTNFAVIGLDTVASVDRKRIKNELENAGKELIFLSNEQVYQDFAGNMLQLRNASGQQLLVMSERARSGLRMEQIKQIERLGNQIVSADLSTIEKYGGGSARCMMAELITIK